MDFFYEFPNVTNLKNVREGLNKNSEQLEQAFNYIPVEWFGVSTSNTTTDNDKAIIDAISSMKTNGHGLQFGVGTYLFANQWSEITGEDFFAIRGVNSAGLGDTKYTEIKRTTNVVLIRLNGTTLLSGGPMMSGAIIKDIRLNGGDFSADLVQCFSTYKFLMDNVYFRFVDGVGLHLWETMDSRILNCDFEWLGTTDGTKPGILLRSGDYDDGTGLISREFTNQVIFDNCRSESYRGVMVATAGDNVNEIFFTTCKFEGLASNTEHLVFNGANTIVFDDCVVSTRGSDSTPVESLVTFTDCEVITWNGLIEAVGTPPATHSLESLIKIDTCFGVKINLGSVASNDRITGGYLIKRIGGNSSGYQISVQHQSGSDKEVIDGNGLVRNENLGKRKYYSSGEPTIEIEKTGTATQSSWALRAVGDGTNSRLNFVKETDSVEEVVAHINQGGDFFVDTNFFIDNGLYLGKLTASPPYVTEGLTYYDDTTDIKAVRQFINGGWVRVGRGTTAPIAGAWSLEDRVYNSNPTAGGYVGWVCISSGSPGTWKGFGLIEV